MGCFGLSRVGSLATAVCRLVAGAAARPAGAVSHSGHRMARAAKGYRPTGEGEVVPHRGGGGYRHGMSWGASVVCDHVRSVFLRLCVAGGMDGMVKPGGRYR